MFYTLDGPNLITVVTYTEDVIPLVEGSNIIKAVKYDKDGNKKQGYDSKSDNKLTNLITAIILPSFTSWKIYTLRALIIIISIPHSRIQQVMWL